MSSRVAYLSRPTKAEILVLSKDLLVYLTKFLSYIDVINLIRTARVFHSAYTIKDFWKYKLLEEYPRYYSDVEDATSSNNDEYRLTYKCLSLLPLMYIEKESTRHSHMTFMYPVPRQEYDELYCEDNVVDNIVCLTPDILIQVFSKVIIVYQSKRQPLLGSLPLVGQDLPKYRLGNMGNVTRTVKAHFATFGASVLILEQQYLSPLLTQISIAGYYFTEKSYTGGARPEINKGIVKILPDLFVPRPKKNFVPSGSPQQKEKV